MQKSRIALISVLIVAALYGAALMQAHVIAAALCSAALAGGMYHFRTLTNDWTSAECWFNFPLAIVGCVCFVLAGHVAIAQFGILCLGAGFMGIVSTFICARLLTDLRGRLKR